MENIQFEAKTVDGNNTSRTVQGIEAGGEQYVGTFQADWKIDRALKTIEIKRAYWSFDAQGNHYKIYISYTPANDGPAYANINYNNPWSSSPTNYIRDVPDFETIFAADSGRSKIQFLIKQSKEAPSGTKTSCTISNVKLNIEYEILQRDSEFSISAKTVTTNKSANDNPSSFIRMTVVPGSDTYRHTVRIVDVNDETRYAEFTFNNISGSQSQLFKPTDGTWLPGMKNATSMTARLTYQCFDNTGAEIDKKEQDITIKCRDYNEEADAINVYMHKITDNTYPQNSTPTFFLQNWSTLIVTASSSQSNAEATITGYCGSTISDVLITCGPKSRYTQPSHNESGYTNPDHIKLEVGTIAKTGSTTITVVLTDSRGKKRTLSNSISVSPYSPPYIGRFIVGRCASDGKPDASNMYGFAVCDAVYQNKIGGSSANNNSITKVYYDGKPGESGTNVMPSYDKPYTVDNQTYHVDVFGTKEGSNETPTQFAAEYSHTVYVRVQDSVGGYCIQKATIQTGAVFMSWRKGVNAIGFGGIPNVQNSVYVSKNMKLMWGQEDVMPANYLRIRPATDITLSSGTVDIWFDIQNTQQVKLPIQQDDNKLFEPKSITQNGAQRTVVECKTDCYAEFSGNLYLGSGFCAGQYGDFFVYVKIKRHKDNSEDTLGLARIRPWTSDMYCTFAMAPTGIALHNGDEISFYLYGASNATGTISKISSSIETFITIRAIDFIAAVE